MPDFMHSIPRSIAAVLLTTLAAFAAGCGGNRSAAVEDRGAAHTPDPALPARETPGADHDADAKPKGSTDRVTLTPEAFRTAQIQVDVVRATPSATTGESLDVPGSVETDPRRVALVSSRIAGRIERLAVVEGDRVGAGQAVAALYSPEFLTAQADVQQATRRATVLAGTPDESGARALAEASRRRMRLLGATDAEVERLAAGGAPATALTLRAPLGGSVLHAHVLPGAAVEAGAPVFTVADLSVVDVMAEVPERALALVRPGQAATVSIAAFPGMRAAGRVERLKDALNPETRTVQAVIHVPNVGGRLRPGMFATVRLAVSTRDALALQAVATNDQSATPAGQPAAARAVPGASTVLTVPERAVVTDGERRFVFVEVGPRTYERREVRVTPLAPPGSAAVRLPVMVVQDGLRAGERVVVAGAFTLKSELAKASLADVD